MKMSIWAGKSSHVVLTFSELSILSSNMLLLTSFLLRIPSARNSSFLWWKY